MDAEDKISTSIDSAKKSKKRRSRQKKKRSNSKGHEEDGILNNTLSDEEKSSKSNENIAEDVKCNSETEDLINISESNQNPDVIDDKTVDSLSLSNAEADSTQTNAQQIKPRERKRMISDDEHSPCLEVQNVYPPAKMWRESEGEEDIKDTKRNEQERISERFSDHVRDVGTNNKNVPMEKATRGYCHCSIMDRQQREIVNLKRKLQEREVYGPSAKGDSEHRKGQKDSEERLNNMESKLNSMLRILEDQKKKTTAAYSVESLHNKVDKLIRLLSDVAENQKKNSKIISQLQKANEAQAQKEQDELEKLKKTRFSASLPSNIVAIASKEVGPTTPKPEEIVLKSSILTDKKKDEVDDAGITSSPLQPPKPPDPLEEIRWGENMVLVGDTFWRSFLRLDDVKIIVDKMEKGVRFRINAGRDNEVIRRLYDSNREKILFALPPKVKNVGISIGATDILEAKSEHIKTLREGPLAEVKRHNLPTLQYMAKTVKDMIQKLLAMDKFVLLLIPLYGSQRREVFDQWQNVLKETMDDLPFPQFRILNLSDLMKSTLAQFSGPQQMFETWLSNTSALTLSAYGTRRLFDALKKAVWATSKKSLESGMYLKNTTPSPMQQKCPRCLRFHQGGPDTCKSRNMVRKHIDILLYSKFE